MAAPVAIIVDHAAGLQAVVGTWSEPLSILAQASRTLANDIGMFLSISLQEPDCHDAKVFPKAAKFHCQAALYSQVTEPRESSLLISCSSTPAGVPSAVMRQFRHGMSRFWYQAEPSSTALTASLIAGIPFRFGLVEESVAQPVHIFIDHFASLTAVIETWAEPLLVLSRASAALAQDASIFRKMELFKTDCQDVHAFVRRLEFNWQFLISEPFNIIASELTKYGSILLPIPSCLWCNVEIRLGELVEFTKSCINMLSSERSLLLEAYNTNFGRIDQQLIVAGSRIPTACPQELHWSSISLL